MLWKRLYWKMMNTVRQRTCAIILRKGDIRDFDAVYNFGRSLDAITIEIESVNVEALEKLENEGIKIYPSPSAIRTIKNKITQKDFYKAGEIPTPEYIVTENLSELREMFLFYLLPTRSATAVMMAEASRSYEVSRILKKASTLLRCLKN
jgi:phosphoribosylaminoimidazole carboxylase (NCAIR synthetase)